MARRRLYNSRYDKGLSCSTNNILGHLLCYSMGKGKGTSWLEAQYTNTPVQKGWYHWPRKLVRNKLAFGSLFNYSHFILKRIQNELNKQLRDEQHGFCPNRSCTDLIFTFRVLAEECRQWSSRLYMILIDFEKTFDSVDWASLWKSFFIRVSKAKS